MLLAVASFFTAIVAGQPQVPAHERAGAASQEHANSSTKTRSSSKGRKIPCKTPENASLCYWAHGRLSIYNGNPSDRIWKIGTSRILGVFNGPSHFPPHTIADDEDPELPVNLGMAYEADYRRWKQSEGNRDYEFPVVFADFEVCPLEPEKKRGDAGSLRRISQEYLFAEILLNARQEGVHLLCAPFSFWSGKYVFSHAVCDFTSPFTKELSYGPDCVLMGKRPFQLERSGVGRILKCVALCVGS